MAFQTSQMSQMNRLFACHGGVTASPTEDLTEERKEMSAVLALRVLQGCMDLLNLRISMDSYG